MARGFVDGLQELTVPASELDNGVEPAGSNITPVFSFSEEVANIHRAQDEGFGPRYGMAPIPYHNIPVSISQPSLVDLETSVGSGGDGRLKIFGIHPLKLATYASVGPVGLPASHYFWVCTGLYDGVTETLGLVCNVNTGSGNQPYGPNIDTRLSRFNSLAGSSTGFLPLLAGSTSSTNKRLLNTWSNAYASTVALTVPGRVVEMAWLLGFIRVNTSGAKPPLVEFDEGYTSEFAYLNQQAGARRISVYRIENLAPYPVTRTQYDVTTGVAGYYLFRNLYSKGAMEDINVADVTITATRTYGAAGAYTQENLALYNDPLARHNQRHSVIACAFGRPYGFVVKEEYLTTITGGILPFMCVDFTNFAYYPRDQVTLDQSAGTVYTENGAAKKTCWRYWANWTLGTASPTDAVLGTANADKNVALGAADSGILRADTVYEVTYSIYNKALGHETNVGTPAKIETGSDEFVSLLLRRSQTTGGTAAGANEAVLVQNAPFAAPGILLGNSQQTFVNLFEFRVYYREFGSFEWLPAGRIDCANYYYNASERTWAVCTGAIGALPGGQPGGFIDNSPLPDDAYFQTFYFNKRLFWVSPKSIAFSSQDNPYCYSVRNAFGCPSGDLLGCIVHAYPGEAQQAARIIVFTTEETFTARFRGQEFGVQEPVRVSADSVATYYVDGSDFDIQPWTSITAFSYRTAINADGILYWWGPRGVFRDDGVDVPSKEWSRYMDILLNTLYDKTQTQTMCSIYNSRTHECIWFYRDRDGSQKALVYNTAVDSFFLWSFSNILIDAAQILDVQTSGTSKRTLQGPRIVLHVRDKTDTSVAQRSVFFDELVDAGDLRISRAYLVDEVATSGANRRLYIDPGFVGSLPTSGNLTISGAAAYRDNSDDVDGIYAIAGGNGTSYIDIAPIGGSWSGHDFTIGSIASSTNYFPVWVESVHGFELTATSFFWAPNGINFWGRWLYCAQVFHIPNILRSSGYQISMEWLSTVGGDTPNARTLTLSDNFRGNYRVDSQIAFSQQNNVGHGLSTTWTTPSGVHNGGKWRLQYLSYRVNADTQGNNRMYEG